MCDNNYFDKLLCLTKDVLATEDYGEYLCMTSVQILHVFITLLCVLVQRMYHNIELIAPV